MHVLLQDDCGMPQSMAMPMFTPILVLITSCHVLLCKFCLSNLRLFTVIVHMPVRRPRASRVKILVQPSHKDLVMAASQILAR